MTLQLVSAGMSNGAAFTACIGTQDLTNLGLGQTVIFESVITNLGGHYHTTTGIFTAPESGMYVFHVSIMTASGKYMVVHIVKDGVAIDRMRTDAIGDSSWESSSEMWVLQLNSGSEVWIQTAYDEGEIHGSCHSMFSGFLLYYLEL